MAKYTALDIDGDGYWYDSVREAIDNCCGMDAKRILIVRREDGKFSLGEVNTQDPPVSWAPGALLQGSSKKK